mgnify:CR=1 FL=1
MHAAGALAPPCMRASARDGHAPNPNVLPRTRLAPARTHGTHARVRAHPAALLPRSEVAALAKQRLKAEGLSRSAPELQVRDAAHEWMTVYCPRLLSPPLLTACHLLMASPCCTYCCCPSATDKRSIAPIASGRRLLRRPPSGFCDAQVSLLPLQPLPQAFLRRRPCVRHGWRRRRRAAGAGHGCGRGGGGG